MQNIQIKVKLINSMDEMLINREWLNPNKLRVYEIEGFVDNDSVQTVVPMKVIELLGLRIRRQQIVKYPDGKEETIGQARTCYY
jgi:hypothetical protein